jgi:hypothetical protein
MRKDLHSHIYAFPIIEPAVQSASSISSAICDMQGYNALEFLFQAGTITTGNFAVSLQHGNAADLSDAVTVPADQIIGTLPVFTAFNDGLVKNVGYIPTLYRYVRAVLTNTSSPNGILGALAIKSSPYLVPTA